MPRRSTRCSSSAGRGSPSTIRPSAARSRDSSRALRRSGRNRSRRTTRAATRSSSPPTATRRSCRSCSRTPPTRTSTGSSRRSRARAATDFETYITGGYTADADFRHAADEDLKTGELFGIGAALVVLLLVFGAVVASLVPVVLAIVSIAVALGLTALVGQAFELSFFVVNMLVMMGLAVGIDYALFVMTRFREERGAWPREAGRDLGGRGHREPGRVRQRHHSRPARCSACSSCRRRSSARSRPAPSSSCSSPSWPR